MDPNDQKKTACYDIDVEVDDTLKTQMNSFLLSTASQQEIAGLDNKVHLTIHPPHIFRALGCSVDSFFFFSHYVKLLYSSHNQFFQVNGVFLTCRLVVILVEPTDHIHKFMSSVVLLSLPSQHS